MNKYLIICFAFILFASCNKTNRAQDKSNRNAIATFYNKALTVSNSTKPTAALTPFLAEGYKSSSSLDSKGAKELMGQLEFFWKVIPDLKWEPQEIFNEGDVYIVRSIASGTPNGNFMGVPTDGSKSFKIMTIDRHTMKDGKFVSTYHVEDWATAMKQLKRNQPNNNMDKKSKETMDVAMAFMDAMGKGEMDKMMSLMHDDMVWQNAGDKSLPWIGPWKGKEIILEKFMPLFGGNFKTIKWEPNDAVSNGDTAAFFGQMVGLLTKSNKQTKEFTYALRVKVKDGKVILWNWFEDSFEVSRAYHGK
ncbi:nuclear transport factor 2 family protein [uncultured Lacinutrix sp.]|uniref:nuclear transport factor 2 family protein n=1 Tax=uncultured Lacinutrix sp. TaxID=574032 RepID=UPI00262A00C9|nr:nuclear transport factor 2 family protein [uncultured Lacinutrix sp.]